MRDVIFELLFNKSAQYSGIWIKIFSQSFYPSTFYAGLFRVKRGDYLIVSGDDEYTISSEASSGVSQFRVEHILYKDQVRHIKNNGLWPHLFEGNNDESRHGSIEETSSRMTAPMGPTTSEAPAANSKKLVIGANDFGLMDDAEMEGSESEEEEAGAELFVNTNRRQMKPAAPDSSSDEDEEE